MSFTLKSGFPVGSVVSYNPSFRSHKAYSEEKNDNYYSKININDDIVKTINYFAKLIKEIHTHTHT